MDYSKMSDHEINKMVAISLGKDVMPDDCQDFGISGFPEVMLRSDDIKDYCNEASDAWPIIAGNGISLIKCIVGSGYWSAEIITDIDEVTDNLFQCQSSLDAQDASPFRAAMVVYLMMREVSDVQGNPA